MGQVHSSRWERTRRDDRLGCDDLLFSGQACVLHAGMSRFGAAFEHLDLTQAQKPLATKISCWRWYFPDPYFTLIAGAGCLDLDLQCMRPPETGEGVVRAIVMVTVLDAACTGATRVCRVSVLPGDIVSFTFTPHFHLHLHHPSSPSMSTSKSAVHRRRGQKANRQPAGSRGRTRKKDPPRICPFSDLTS